MKPSENIWVFINLINSTEWLHMTTKSNSSRAWYGITIIGAEGERDELLLRNSVVLKGSVPKYPCVDQKNDPQINVNSIHCRCWNVPTFSRGVFSNFCSQRAAGGTRIPHCCLEYMSQKREIQASRNYVLHVS